MTPARFDAERAKGYDDRVSRAIPGYGLLHDIAAVTMAALVPPQARLLVVGCGTGTDILRLAPHQPGWSFVGVDPAAEMLALARLRLAEAGLEGRTTLVEGRVEAVEPPPAGGFDGALCLLVGHFLPDSPATAEAAYGKAALLAGVAALLRPGAPLLIADFALPPPTEVLPAGLIEDAWTLWQHERGIAAEAIDRGLAHARRAIHPIDPARLGALLGAAGFTPPAGVFQALQVRGWLSFRKDDR
ncbi:class I SAM-dependent methyltransferase [Rhodospirillum rubrum]|uniref:Methyltransferase type 12 domain-containing protein n=1 Tax=Rhodospirillum rubrum (strain ATCC 11170 / ATH 1.1.1 / DSM 467 / LMG 4362 / NCIMB 8255 / S1) TaxID=269796 RepID=Q2RN49_RHORT|nr:class I SAM-dependent methyltransferase [Rhodospirillum rubrum]ABC24446.1 conserved hypothetical protein [Rhodospirillum rubrum ATCC 11170]AEO50197.1 hypothetical protein F11_18685 [Rhodospirillum rubrum F11]MBK5956166.1 SAM-dependent methyltransferase [Rhodospirillum rubrum]QXG80368.1 class I SAM-dependent methyltransferase [Rhodospirillum rubrum]HAP99594.1 class I SAM-dependent methyltransferase [Rhodospirillum rubrum]